jgi:hypothetical protein
MIVQHVREDSNMGGQQSIYQKKACRDEIEAKQSGHCYRLGIMAASQGGLTLEASLAATSSTTSGGGGGKAKE